MHFTKYQLPDSPGAGAVFFDRVMGHAVQFLVVICRVNAACTTAKAMLNYAGEAGSVYIAPQRGRPPLRQ